MAKLLLWMQRNKVLLFYFSIYQTLTLPLDIIINVKTRNRCSQPLICRQDLGNLSWSIIASPYDMFALGKSVRALEGGLVMLSSYQLNYFTMHHDKQEINMCSFNVSTYFLKQKHLTLESVYKNATGKGQTVFDSINPGNTSLDYLARNINILLSREDWRTIVIFTSSYEELTTLSSSIQLASSQLLLFTITDDLQLKKTLGIIYTMFRLKDLNFIVVCSTRCIMEFLHKATEFETLAGKPSKWLLVPTEGCISDVINSSFQVPSVNLVTLELAVSTKEQISVNLDIFQDLFFNLKGRVTSKEYAGIADYIHTAMVHSISSVFVNVYAVYTSQYSREIQHIGNISPDGDVTVVKDLFPGFKHGLNNRTLIISTLEWPPFVIKKDENGFVRYSGVCIDLLEELSRVLNFSYKIVEPEDQEWGRVFNERWTGLIGQLAYKKVDLVVAPIAVQKEREYVMDFTVPYFYEQSLIVLREPDISSSKWRTLIVLYRYEVHICILISLILSTLVLFVVEEMYPGNILAENRLSGRRTRYGDIFWHHFGALTANGSAYLPNTQSGRFVLGCWWLFTVISAAIYSGNLVAFLSDWQVKSPFSSLTEMIEQDTYKWGTLGGTSYITMFQSSSNPVYRKVWKGLESDPEATSLNIDVHERRILSGQYAFLGEKTIVDKWMSEHCDLQIINDQFFSMNFGIGLHNNSVYTSMFSNQVLRIYEIGLPRVWYKRWGPSMQCETSLSAKRVDLLTLQSVFYAAGVGVLLASTVLITEILYKRKCRQASSSVTETNSLSVTEKATDTNQTKL